MQHERDELIERQPAPDISPGVAGHSKVAPDSTPVLRQDAAERSYSDSSIPANLAQPRSMSLYSAGRSSFCSFLEAGEDTSPMNSHIGAKPPVS